MKVNVARARTEANIKKLDAQEKEAIKYCEAIACLVLRDEMGWNKSGWDGARMKWFVRGVYKWLAETFEQYRAAGDEKFSAETVPTVYVGLRNQVKALDADVGRIEDEYAFAEFFAGWRPGGMVTRRAFRYQHLKDREQTFRAFWYTMMLYLHEKYGFGKTRLERFYALCRARYKEDYDFYLLCTAEGDTAIQKRTRAVIKEATDLGIEL
jgi:hypothetical protein